MPLKSIFSSLTSAALPLVLLFTLLACSSPNSLAPSAGQAHPPGYMRVHGQDAAVDLTACQSCHLPDFTGGENAANCFDCHTEGDGFALHSLPYTNPEAHGVAARNDQAGCLACHGTAPNQFDGGIVADSDLFAKPAGTCSAAACHPAAGAHPTNWQGSNDTNADGYSASHRVVTQTAIDASCALCHQVISEGPAPLAEAPSCFSASFTNSDGSTSGCHPDGKGEGAHALPFEAAGLHGPSAKADLASCQACHGTPATTDFDGGLSAVSCATAACHPTAGAHPTNWQGTNDISGDYASSHRDAANATTGCAICHDVTEGRTPPNPEAPSCFNASFTNSDGSTSGCHNNGPGTVPHALPYTAPIQHGATAKANLVDCQACHGTPNTTQFDGGIADTGCATAECHPAAGAHPTNWQGENDPTSDYVSSHRNADQQSANCSLCHDFTEDRTAPLDEAPSCFSVSFTNSDGSTSGCHISGPGTVPHALPYTAPTQHGATAKTNLVDCQACHGTPNTTQFDGGIADTGCATAECHPAAGAHPTNWEGSNDSSSDYTSTHRDVANATSGCAICHDVTEGRRPPNSAAPSCFNASFTNSDGSTSGCHSTGPGTVPHAMPYGESTQHGAAAKANLSDCQACHGTPDSTQFNGGIAATSCATSECHPAAGAHPTYWQGENDPTSDYVSSHRNAGQQNSNCSLCHDYSEDRTAPLNEAPSCFSASFTNSDGSTSGCHNVGPGASHALPFTDPLDHGPEAKADLRACVACHATPADAGAGDNPRFNRPIGDLPQGCETSGCHSPFTAHPIPLWAGAETTSHVSAGNQAEACALCHGTGLGGGADAPACASCHELGSPLTVTNCASCHASPPNDAGNTLADRPNRDGAHSAHQGYNGVTDNCTVCHNGAGANANNHFDTTAPATISLESAYNAESGAASFNSDNSSCSSTRCHGGRTSPNWYTGSINVATDCTACHTSGTSQYNGYYSGEHDKHVRDLGLDCTRCHDATKIADPNGAHLSDLATTSFEQPASATLQPEGDTCLACHSDEGLSDWND